MVTQPRPCNRVAAPIADIRLVTRCTLWWLRLRNAPLRAAVSLDGSCHVCHPSVIRVQRWTEHDRYPTPVGVMGHASPALPPRRGRCTVCVSVRRCPWLQSGVGIAESCGLFRMCTRRDGLPIGPAADDRETSGSNRTPTHSNLVQRQHQPFPSPTVLQSWYTV